MSTRLLFLLIVANVSFAQTSPPEARFDVWFVQRADPKAELERNAGRGDTRFLCINLIGRACPGHASEERMAKHGTRMIEDIGDVPRSDEHARAILRARDYAGVYNDLLLEWLKTHE